MTYSYVHRDIEPILKELITQFPALVITGPRQSGKSTLLKRIFGAEYKYHTFDDPLTREKALADPLLFLEDGNSKLIIDEIQHVPELLSYIKLAIDKNRNKRGRFILTGSQQFALMKNLADTLAGRIAVLELLPFSINEKKKILSEKKYNDSKNYFIDGLLRGSFPELVKNHDIASKFWYGSYIQTYLERDIRTLYNIGDLRDFQRLLHLLAARAAQLLNLSELARDLGVAVNTVKKWVSILEASRIITLLKPYYKNFGKRMVKSPKVYFLDCGLLCYLLSISSEEDIFDGPFKGALFENFCVQETMKHFINSGLIPELYFVRTHDGLGIDLLLERSGALYPIEFKCTKTVKMSMIYPIEIFRKWSPKPEINKGAIVSLSDTSPNKEQIAQNILALDMDVYLAWLKRNFKFYS